MYGSFCDSVAACFGDCKHHRRGTKQLLKPQMRARLKDKATKVRNDVNCFVSKEKKHLGNKLLGLEHELDKFSEKVCEKSEEMKEQMEEKTQQLKENFKRMDEKARSIASEAGEKIEETREQLAEKANKAREQLANKAAEVAENFSPHNSTDSSSSSSSSTSCGGVHPNWTSRK